MIRKWKCRTGARQQANAAVSGARSSSPAPGEPLLTVIVPVYNEASTIDELLRRVLAAPCDKEVLVVDDASSDRTSAILEQWYYRPGVTILAHSTNRGKGAAIRTALPRARGRFTIIQDADLEYDPQDYPRLIEPLLSGNADVVYGSRYMSRPAGRPRPWSVLRAGVSLLNWSVWLLYGVKLTDEATCYKVFPAPVLRAMELQCERFEFCPEVTAKACRMGLEIMEVPIHYEPRSVKQGKNIRWRDGWEALRTLWRCRNWRPTGAAEEWAAAAGSRSRSTMEASVLQNRSHDGCT
ncbi:MAG: glycosyltransferase family 2 protein [Thermoguttaceae bacterium]|jgi:hypothetical protein|nr:glycosyltransferase family 2 protein [Thermoguttaceae bacterium]